MWQAFIRLPVEVRAKHSATDKSLPGRWENAMITSFLKKEILSAARACRPFELCGVVKNEQFIKMKNIAQDPCNNFELDPLEFAQHDPVQYIVHSHPQTDRACPSAYDMEQQALSGIPWIIASEYECVVLDANRVTPPLEGREFIPGIDDCYSLIRDYYRLRHDLIITDYPRDPEWWKAGQNLYFDNFSKAGFVPIKGPGQDGDMFMASILSPVPNHSGIYFKNGLILHHLTDRLSRLEPLNNWKKYINIWVRHENLFTR